MYKCNVHSLFDDECKSRVSLCEFVRATIAISIPTCTSFLYAYAIFLLSSLLLLYAAFISRRKRRRKATSTLLRQLEREKLGSYTRTVVRVREFCEHLLVLVTYETCCSFSHPKLQLLACFSRLNGFNCSRRPCA